eukprot:5009230-Ditylum_brightwellii.AAC.1
MHAESLSDFLEEVPSSTRNFLFKLTFSPHIGSLFCNLFLEMCLKRLPFLNLLPPVLLLDETTAQVSAEKTAAIEDMVDMPTAIRSKISTAMNTIGMCKTKENILETIANWLLLLNHNFVVDVLALQLLYGALFMLVVLITSCDYKN